MIGPGPLNNAQANSSASDDDDSVLTTDLGRVRDSPDPCEDPTTQEGCHLGWDTVFERHHLGTVDDHLVGKCCSAQAVGNRFTVEVRQRTPMSEGKVAGAGDIVAASACPAVAACTDQRDDNPVTDSDVVDALAKFHDAAGCLVAKNHGKVDRPTTVKEHEVRVAYGAGVDGDTHLVGTGCSQEEFLD